MFGREAVQAGLLTAEHVPPRSFRGKELLLTCAPCNHTSGARLDAEARKRENPRDAMTGRAQKSVAVLLTAGGHTIPASLSTKGRTHTLKVPQAPLRPGAEEGFQAAVHHDASGNRDIHMNFHADRFSAKHARASWLRAAYLALFAVAGYRYVLQPALAIVRRQIAEPEVEHIPTFMVTLSHDPPWTERRLVHVRSPAWQQCWTVQIGRYAIFLPKPGDVSLYDRITESRRDGKQSVTVIGDTYDWPTQPTFGTD